MPAAKTYGNFVKKIAPNHKTAAFRMIKTGLHLEKFRTAHFLDKRIPQAYQYLNHYAIGNVLEALQHPEHTAWVNIFTPVELLQCFDLYCLSAEAVSVVPFAGLVKMRAQSIRIEHHADFIICESEIFIEFDIRNRMHHQVVKTREDAFLGYAQTSG